MAPLLAHFQALLSLVLAAFLLAPQARAESPCSISLTAKKELAYVALGRSIDDLARTEIGMPSSVASAEGVTTYRYGNEDCYLAFATREGEKTIRRVAFGKAWDAATTAQSVTVESLEGLANAFGGERRTDKGYRWSWGDAVVDWQTEGRATEMSFTWMTTGDAPRLPTLFEGVWERQGDELAGMRVRVYNADDDPNVFQAELVAVPEQARSAGFEEGQVKWAHIRRLSADHYTFDDLFVSVFGSRHRASVIRTEGDRLHTALMDGEAAGTGTSQTWVRIWNQ